MMRCKVLFIFLFFFVGGAMAKQTLGISYTGISDIQARSMMFIDGDDFKFTLPGSSSDEFYGIGVYRGVVTADQEKLVDKFIKLVRSKKNWPPPEKVDRYSYFGFSFSNENGVRIEGRIDLDGKQGGLGSELIEVYYDLAKSFYKTGRKIAHVAGDYNVVKQEDGRYLLTLTFINSGSQAVVIGNPEKWSGVYRDSGVSVGGVPSNLMAANKIGDGFRLNFGGVQLIKKAMESPGDIRLLPGESQSIQFIGNANDGASQKEGPNNFGGSVYFEIQLPESQWMRADLLLPSKQIILPNR